MNLKKIIAFFLSFCFLLPVVFLVSRADDEGIYTYTVSDGKAMITHINYRGLKRLEIPETLGGYPVTAISSIDDSYAYGTANMVEELYIPASVTLIGSSALRQFDCAKTVVSEDNPNYSSDEYGVVFNKDKTVLVACPCSLQQKEYTLPETVKSIEYLAFEQCAFIEKIVLPAGLSSLGNQSFCQMPRLREINIPEGITELGQNMFIQCSSLEEIILPSTLKKVSNSSLSETSLKSVVVPDGVTQIDTFAFESCKKLEYIELPVTLTAIGYEALANCSSLKYILYRGSEEDWAKISINSSNTDDFEKYGIVFNYAPEAGYPGIDFSFENGVLTLNGEGAVPSFNAGDYHYWNGFADKCDVIAVEQGISGLGSYSFENFKVLEYLVVYSDDISIAENAFSGCDALENIIITGGADFSPGSFGVPGATVYIDAAANPTAEQEAGTVRFTCTGETLNFIDDAVFDIYHLLDFVSALAGKYGVINKITFGNMTLSDIELNYIAGYTDDSEPVIEKIEDSTLVNGEIKVAVPGGNEISFNELIDIIRSGSEDGFSLIVSDENHQTVINTNVDIEDPGTDDNPTEPDKNDNDDSPNGAVLFLESVHFYITNAIKWAVTLMNKLFKLITKK